MKQTNLVWVAAILSRIHLDLQFISHSDGGLWEKHEESLFHSVQITAKVHDQGRLCL